jgi:hypothetical protein
LQVLRRMEIELTVRQWRELQKGLRGEKNVPILMCTCLTSAH